MKKLFITALAGLTLAACGGGGSELASKKKELAELKTTQKETVEKIAALEKEISKLDTAFKVETKAKLIGVDTLQVATFKHFIEVQGQVDAADNVLAIQSMPGIVTAIYVKEGDRVSAGQVLYATDASTYEKQISIVESQLALAKTAYERQERLWAQNIGSEIQVLTAKTNKEAAEKQIATLRATVEMSKCKSPINGTVDEVRVKLGDMSAASALMPGVRVINSSKLVIKAKLSDSQIGKLKAGDKVQVNFPDINKTIESTVSFVAQVVDKVTRTFNVEVRLDNKDANFKANMIAKLMMNDEIVNNALIVPSNVIQKGEDGGEYVLVAENKKATKRLVKSGLSYDGKTLIESGLKAGDVIITFGYSEVVDGQKIDFNK